MGYIIKLIQTKPFVQIKANFGIHKIWNRQIILYFTSFVIFCSAVSENKSKMWKVNERRMTDNRLSQKCTWGFAPQFRTKVARVRFWIKGSWRLWFGIWVLYFHRMLNITYQVLEVDWPLTLSAKIGGHVTWVICYLSPVEIMEFLRSADVLSAVFH